MLPKSSEKCEGVVRPNIVFFGEALPDRLWKNMKADFSACDLLIVLGTSLTVQPFANLVGQVGKDIPRLFINRTNPGKAGFLGILYCLSLKYKPVDGDRKSGIPAEVEIPAPHIITTFSIFSFLMDLITSSRRYFSSFCSREMNWPIFS